MSPRQNIHNLCYFTLNQLKMFIILTFLWITLKTKKCRMPRKTLIFYCSFNLGHISPKIHSPQSTCNAATEVHHSTLNKNTNIAHVLYPISFLCILQVESYTSQPYSMHHLVKPLYTMSSFLIGPPPGPSQDLQYINPLLTLVNHIINMILP